MARRFTIGGWYPLYIIIKYVSNLGAIIMRLTLWLIGTIIDTLEGL